MLRLRLALTSALCSAACAQIAGFDTLSSRQTEAAGGGSNVASAGTLSSSGNRGAEAGHAPSGGGGESASGPGVGNSGSGGNASNASSGHGGSANSAGSLGGGGSPGGAGSPGSGGSAGSAQAAGAAGATLTGGCNAQLLKNADFEAGPLEWRQESKAPGITEVSDLIVEKERPALMQAGVKPESGNYLAWLGGVLDSDKGSRTNLLQDVQIPAKVSKLVLSGWVLIKTTEPDPKNTTDQLDLTLQDDNNYWSFHFWKGTEVTNGWQAFSYEISEGDRLDAVRGRTLTFYAEAIADTTEITSFWLDSLSLVAQCPH